MGFLERLLGVTPGKRTVGQSRAAQECYEVHELMTKDALEFGLRKAAFYACVNIIANFLGNAEMRYFRAGQEVKGNEWWRWNYEPNRNQNASAFWHQLVTRLYEYGEALIIDEPYGDGFVVADSFCVDETEPATVYRDVVWRSRTRERVGVSQAMHIVLDGTKMKPILDAMTESFGRLANTAMNQYLFNGGQHWKASIQATAPNTDEEIDVFQQIVDAQMKPFFETTNGVLPEWDGYKYEQITGGDKSKLDSKDIRELAAEIWNETAMAMLVPPVLIQGKVADDKTAMTRLLSGPIDTIGKQVEREACRIRLGKDRVLAGERIVFDSSNLIHYDIMENASSIQALIGSAAYSVNDVLRTIGKATIPEAWADKHYMTLNISQTAVEDQPEKPAES